jgi:hypothetical protein
MRWRMRQLCERCGMNAWSSNEGNSNHWNDRTGTDARRCHENKKNSDDKLRDTEVRRSF